MTAKKLGEAIDALGALRDRIHALKTDETAFTAGLKKALAAVKGKTKRAAGENYEAELKTSKAALVIEDLAALRRAAGRKFLGCVKADVAAARCQLGDDVLERLGHRGKPTGKVCVYKKEPGKAPRRSARKR